MILHPAAFAALMHEAARAPFVIAGPALEAVRAKLAERAASIVSPVRARLRLRA
jgi:hypothetical protein